MIFVLHELARVFHQRKQARFGDPGGMAGFIGLHLGGDRAHGDSCRSLFADRERLQDNGLRLFAHGGKHRAPTCFLERASPRAKLLALDFGDSLDAFPDRGRKEVPKKASDHEIEEPLVISGQRSAGQRSGRNHRKVVGDLRIVECPLDVEKSRFLQPGGSRREFREFRASLPRAVGEVADRLIDDFAIIVGQATRVGSRIGENLVALVTSLCGTQRSARRPTETAVPLSLQTRQIEERRRGFPGGFAGLFGDRGLAGDRSDDGRRAVFVEDPVVLEFRVLARLEARIEPGPLIGGAVVIEVDEHLPIGARYVGENLELLVDQHREGRSLDTTRRPGGLFLAALEALGERARRVHSDHPIALGATGRGGRESIEI